MITDYNNTKVCNKCLVEKDKSEFSPDKRSLDGCQPSCKQCINLLKKTKYHADIDQYREKHRLYYSQHKDKILSRNKKSNEKNREKVLISKKNWYEKVKNTELFIEKGKKYRELNKERKKQYDANYNKINTEKKCTNAKRWNKNNPEKRSVILFNNNAKRRANKKGGDSLFTILNWKRKQIKLCYWCGIDCDGDYHIDHYQPLAKGGSHTIDNFVISCPSCNLTKNAKDPYKFANELGKLF